jgi:hypothetical protein
MAYAIRTTIAVAASKGKRVICSLSLLEQSSLLDEENQNIQEIVILNNGHLTRSWVGAVRPQKAMS